jgi:hypothetical protein
LAVLLSPSAATPEAVVSEAQAPLRRCSEILRAIARGIESQWTLDQAAGWRQDALGLINTISDARRDHEGHQLNARWKARAYPERLVLEQAKDSPRKGERVAIHTRSIARSLVDGSADARPMPALGAMLASTASATDGYRAWMASADTPTDRQRLSDTIRPADDTLSRTLVTIQERWGNDSTQWLTFGMILAASQRILADVDHPLDAKASELP